MSRAASNVSAWMLRKGADTGDIDTEIASHRCRELCLPCLPEKSAFPQLTLFPQLHRP